MKARSLEAQAEAALGEFAAAYNGHHADRLAALFAPKMELTVAHAGQAEKVRAAELKAYFEAQWANAVAAGPLRFEGAKVKAKGVGAVVLADTNLYLGGAAEKAGHYARMDAALERHGERLLFSRLHFALPEAAAKGARAYTAQGAKAAAYMKESVKACGCGAKARAAKAGAAHAATRHAKA